MRDRQGGWSELQQPYCVWPALHYRFILSCAVVISPDFHKLGWKRLTAHSQQKWQTPVNVYALMKRREQTREAVYVLLVMCQISFEKLYWRCGYLQRNGCFIKQWQIAVKSFWNSFTHILGCALKYPADVGWSELLYWYFYGKSFYGWSHIDQSFHLLKALGRWTLDHCLLSPWQQVEIYIFVL